MKFRAIDSELTISKLSQSETCRVFEFRGGSYWKGNDHGNAKTIDIMYEYGYGIEAYILTLTSRSK